ncbi:MAG: hypothetical protein WC385_00750 [Candidatus Paceibacterota bacterium]|jgi:hypothetical protein
MGEAGTIKGIIQVILKSFIDPLVPILIGLAIILFAWGLFNYLKTGMGDKNEIEGAKSLMFWGMIVFFVMVSVWGLVTIIQNVILGDNPPIVAPAIPFYNFWD